MEAKHHTNWAKPAAFIGFGIGVGILTFGIVGYLLGYGYYDVGVGGWLMLPAVALLAAGGPVVYAGGSSARWTKSITGLRGLRIGGWIAYGVGLGALLVGIAVDWLRAAGGIIGAGSMAMFGLDALFSGNEAADVESMARNDDGVRFGPTLWFVRAADGNRAPVMGIGGAF